MNKWIVWLLGFIAACSHAPVQKVTDLSNDLKKISNNVVLKALAKPVQAEPLDLAGEVKAAPRNKLIGLSASAPGQFLGWVKTSVGFAKGEISEDELQALGPDNGLWYSWRVLKRWDDNSPRVAQIKTIGFFQNQNIHALNLVSGKTPKPYFAWHANVWNAIVANKFVTDLKIQLNATQGVAGAQTKALDCTPASGFYRFMVADATELVIRFRSHCAERGTGIAHPLSLTSYFTFMSDDPVVRVEHILGNDTRELPIMGGYQLSNVAVVSGTLPTVRWVNESSYCTKSPPLSDGQTMAFKTVMSFDPTFDATAQMIATGEPMGFQFYDDARASKAFGVEPLPSTRVTGATLTAAHNEVDSGSSFPNAQAQAWLGMIDQNPGATGAQSDFASTAPLDIQKAQQAYSARKMASILLALYRESYRPNYYWETRNGEEDWVKATSYPELFCWGRCPHRDLSWNPQYAAAWGARTQNQGFIPGPQSGFESDDNQHVSHNHLRWAYELTGSVILEEWLKQKVSQVYWNYYTDWLPHVEAERAWGRTMKHAIALTELFPDLPETALLKSKFAAKLAAYSNAVTQTVNTFGAPAAVPFDANDGRVVGGQWAPAQNAFGHGPFVAVGWMQGFVNEAMALLPNPDLRVLGAAETYFIPGDLKTYFQLPTPSIYTTGGIGIEWTSGWLLLAQARPNAPGAQYILNNLKPVLEARIQHGCGFPSVLFCLNDAWKSW